MLKQNASRITLLLLIYELFEDIIGSTYVVKCNKLQHLLVHT